MDWPKEIASKNGFCKMLCMKLILEKIWPYYLPELGATIDNIVKLKLY